MFISDFSLLSNSGLSLFFATCCIIDLFGVFPVIALPRAIIECGWFGIPLAFIVFFIQIYTAIMLGRCWIIAEHLHSNILEKSRYPYSAMVELAYGKNLSKYANIILYLAIFGGSIPNLIVAAQDLQLIGLKLSEYQVNLSYCYWIIVIGILLCPVMWLGSPKDLKYFAAISVTLVLTASILTWYSLLTDDAPEEPVIPDISWKSTAIAYGILAFQFDVHPMILTIQMDMKNKYLLGKAIIYAFLVSGSLFLITTVICYVRYGNEIRYNTLQGLEPSGFLYADFTVVTLQIILSMAVGATPLFQDLEDRLDIPEGFGWRRCLLRTGVVLSAVLMSEVVPRFDLIMGLIGGALMGQLMFIFPPLLYERLRSMHAQNKSRISGRVRRIDYGSVELFNDKMTVACTHARADLSMEEYLDRPQLFQRTPPVTRSNSSYFSMQNVLDDGPLSVWEKLGNVLVILFGATATILATYYSLRGTIMYADFTPPCITNITLASRLIYRVD